MYRHQRVLSTDELEAMYSQMRDETPRSRLCRKGLHPMVPANSVSHGTYKGKPRVRCKACYFPHLLWPFYLRRQALEDALYALRDAVEKARFPDLAD